jgi:hypothetical protein
MQMHYLFTRGEKKSRARHERKRETRDGDENYENDEKEEPAAASIDIFLNFEFSNSLYCRIFFQFPSPFFCL